MSRYWFLCLCFCVSSAQSDYPFRNTSLSWEDRVNDLVSRLTLKEIMVQMGRGGSGPQASPAPAIPRLGIDPYSWDTECLRGDVSAGKATSFPQALGLAATFSQETIFKVAEATSIEVRAKYNDYRRRKIYGDHKGISCFSPVINIMRHPLWGRNQETYGEDPFLSGILVEQFVHGLQGSNPTYIRANAGCKHFDVHGGPENIPESRFSFNAKVSERDWRLTFLPQFKRCVKAGTYSLMCSYNRINGVPACGNKQLLTYILRNEWNFHGYVISDQAAIENIIDHHHYRNNSVDTVALCVNAGCNIELSTNMKTPVYFSMLEAIKAKKLTESTVRESVKPLFYTRMRTGEFDPFDLNPYNFIDLSYIQSEYHRNISLEATIKSFVLLKNTNSLLPLKKKVGTVSVVGPMANNPAQLFGDYSADMDSKYTTTPLDGLKRIAKNPLKVASGCPDNRCSKYNVTEIQKAVFSTDLVVVCLGTGQELESESNDRPNMELPGHQLQLLQDAVKYSGNAHIILLLFNAGPVNITWAEESSRVSAILECFFPAQAAGEAIWRVLMDSPDGANPGGRLPFTWPKYASQIPSMTNYSMEGRTYRYIRTDPLYPFGYGLSYTQFHYYYVWHMDMIKAGDDLHLRVELGNIGQYKGDEVIQVYIQWLTTKHKMPRRQLVAIKRVTLDKSRLDNFMLTVKAIDMAVLDGNIFIVEEGRIELFVGGQQPGQKSKVPSNVLHSVFYVKGNFII